MHIYIICICIYIYMFISIFNIIYYPRIDCCASSSSRKTTSELPKILGLPFSPRNLTSISSTATALDVEHLLIHLFRGHSATEKCCRRQVATMTRIGRTHHVLRIKHLPQPHAKIGTQSKARNRVFALGSTKHLGLEDSTRGPSSSTCLCLGLC